MKKISYYIALIAVLAIGMAGCGDNTDYWGEHVLTQAEIDELARQDSIREAQRNSINADLILEYAMDMTINNSYTTTALTIEINKIAELFGLSEEEVIAGINQEDGAPEILGFAIEGTTHADNMTSSTTNSTWGHYWDANGNVTTWGDGGIMFCEWNMDENFFAVGPRPDSLTDGQVIKVIECLKYNEKRVAVVITVTARAQAEVSATVVRTQELALTVTPRSSYDQDPVTFDLDQTLADLGIASMDEATFVGVNEDGSYAQEYTASAGFWYDANGFVVAYGDEAVVFTGYGEIEGAEANVIGVGQMPNTLEGGQVITLQTGILANNKLEMLRITITVEAYQDPETRPEGEPTTVEQAITFNKAYDNTYTSAQVDVKDYLREAFKLTTYEIFRAKINGDLKVYLGEVTEAEPEYTADVPGYWMTGEGVASAYAEGVIWCSLGGSETELYLYGGNHPDNCNPNGQTITTKMIITCNGGTAIFNITYNVTAAAATE